MEKTYKVGRNSLEVYRRYNGEMVAMTKNATEEEFFEECFIPVLKEHRKLTLSFDVEGSTYNTYLQTNAKRIIEKLIGDKVKIDKTDSSRYIEFTYEIA